MLRPYRGKAPASEGGHYKGKALDLEDVAFAGSDLVEDGVDEEAQEQTA